jgi:prepilin-type N-terminal cleavage/methylation domain-containing protein
MVTQRTIIAGSNSDASRRRASRAFSLIEVMVVVVLLSVIILGLMAMFDQTQKAFRAGMAQTDQMEGARMFSDMLSRDLEQHEPSYLTNTVNFLALIPGIPIHNYIPNAYVPMQQALPATSVTRTNILEDLFFISRANQTWSGIGYFVRTNPFIGSYVDSVGTLYRYQTNIPVGFGNPQLAFQTFLTAANPAPFTNAAISKILDGVVEFHVRCYDTNGVFINQNSSLNHPTNFVNIQNLNNDLNMPSEVQLYAFSNNIVPAYVEVELGILEPDILKRYNSIPNSTARTAFLASHAGNVQVFRQRIPIRNVDPTAY